MRIEATSRLLPVSIAVAVWVDGFVRVDTDQHHRGKVPFWLWRLGIHG
jgi:hypothetical protein